MNKSIFLGLGIITLAFWANPVSAGCIEIEESYLAILAAQQVQLPQNSSAATKLHDTQQAAQPNKQSLPTPVIIPTKDNQTHTNQTNTTCSPTYIPNNPSVCP